MNETTVTVVGMVCSEIRYTPATDHTTPVARFQLRHTPRRFDKRTETWTDGDPSYYTAVCWRTLADHVASSMGVGDLVVATGRLRINRWRRGEENMVTAELDVQAIGHDLRWGTTVYRRSHPPTRIPGPGRPTAAAQTADRETPDPRPTSDTAPAPARNPGIPTTPLPTTPPTLVPTATATLKPTTSKPTPTETEPLELPLAA
ncbi:single-stranded DNA-binding protein [Catenulispora yoronensis]|uniref:Single-stranded DNA-binding protein n=1 Tax=Catenulispora yoronensis TaxID=450799 RepID=A0ABP5F7K8_9ACTN